MHDMYRYDCTCICIALSRFCFCRIVHFLDGYIHPI